jgi:hypothetical protein
MFEKFMLEKSGCIWQEINGKIDGTKKTLQAIHVIWAIQVQVSEVGL